MIILIKLAGFLFLFIMVLYLILLPAFGYKVEADYEEVWLQNFSDAPKKFQFSIGLALIHNVSVITLTIILFIVYGLPYNIILGIVLLICRMGEGLILIYNDKKYGGFLKIAKQYSSTSGAEKSSLNDLARTITETNSSRFKFGMILWSIGSLAFSIVLVSYVVVPLFIGWLGIDSSILIGLGNGTELIKPNFKTKVSFKVLTVISGLSAIIFEVILGVFLLFF